MRGAEGREVKSLEGAGGHRGAAEAEPEKGGHDSEDEDEAQGALAASA